MKKRIISILLSMSVCLSWLTTGAFAVDSAEVAEPEHDHSAWTAWNEESKLPDATGNYYLNVDVTLNKAWVPPEGETTLCLNGHAIVQLGTEDNVIYMQENVSANENRSDCSLTITDCNKSTEHKFSENSKTGCWTLNSNGAKTIFGGIITNNSNGHSGIRVVGGSLTLQGGTIVGNGGDSDSCFGGGIRLSGGTLAITGASIEHNFARDGGGVYAGSERITMSSGNISNNTASRSGGGIYAHRGFTMEGGTVSSNSASQGGGISIGSFLSGGTKGTLLLKNGTISGNLAQASDSSFSYGVGVYIDTDSKFVMDGGAIVANNVRATIGYGGGVYCLGTLTLNAGTINGNTNGGVCGALTMNGGEICENTGAGYSGAMNNTFEMTGGLIAENSGDGVVITDSKSKMTGGSITGNGRYGVIVGYDSYKFDMSGGTISNNRKGGIYVGKGSLSLSGEIDISKNGTQSRNIYLGKDIVFALSGSISNKTPIGISTEVVPTEENPVVLIEYDLNSSLTAEDVAHFTSDDPNYYVVKTSEGKMVLSTEKPILEGSISINGTPKIGETLTAETTGITSALSSTLSYKWYRGDDATPISGTTGNTYTPNDAADVGKTIKVEVSSANHTGALTATTTSAVVKADGPAAPAAPTLSRKTSESITVAKVDGQQYACVADNAVISESDWTDQSDFSGLTPNTAYEIYTRIKETSTQKASVASAALNVTTDKAPSVPTTVTISGGVSSLTVPSVDAIGSTNSTNSTAFTAEVKDQYGVTMTDQTVTWTVKGNAGVSINGDGVLTITNAATSDAVTVSAECGGKSATKTVTVTKTASAATFVQVKKGNMVVTLDSITIPTSSNTNVSYTAEVYDQYGMKMTEPVNWSISTATGVSVNAGTVSVASDANEGSVTLTVSSGRASTTVSITLSNKPVHNIGSFADITKTITYGDNITGQTVSSTTGTVEYSSSDSSAVSVDESTGALTVRKATTSPVTITARVTETMEYAEVAASYTVMVNKKELTITGLRATDRDYTEGNRIVDLTGGILNGVVVKNEVSVIMPTSGTLTSADAGDGKTVAVTKPELTGSNKDSYTLAEITGLTVNIHKATPDIGAVDYSGNTIYTSTELSAITLSRSNTSVAGNLKLIDGQTLATGTNNYNWIFTPSDTANYKTRTGTVSLTVLMDTLNSIAATGTLNKSTYKYGEVFEIDGLTVTATYASSKTQDVTEQVAFGALAVGQTAIELTYQGKTCTVAGLNVEKAESRTLTDISVKQKYSVVTEQSKQIGNIMPVNAGTLTYIVGTPSVAGTATVSSFSVGDFGLVKYTITGGVKGAIITLPVTIRSTNYGDSTVKVKVALTDKEIPTVKANNIDVTYNGFDVAASVITGTADVEGSWSWKTAAPKTVADSGSRTVVFTPDDTVNYASVEDNITVTISKAMPTGTPTYIAITTGGKMLSDTSLAIGNITPAGGTIKWVNADGADLSDSTEITANTSYKWLYTPSDTANYNTLTGSITLWHRSSGSNISAPAYSVSVDRVDNGFISVSPTTASKGTIVTIMVTPDNGYALDALTVLNKDGEEIKLTEKNGRYTFNMPSNEVIIKGSFVKGETPVETNPFADVKSGDYFYEAVLWAANEEITNGVGNNLFAPNQFCTRAQIVTFLWRAAGSPEPKSVSGFTDVSASSYYAKAVAWADENGIASGTGDGKFSPNASCIREQAVTFLYRAAGSPAVSGGSTFRDVAANTYYANAVTWAEKNGVTDGIGDGLFGTDKDCTRGQIVTFLYRAADK